MNVQKIFFATTLLLFGLDSVNADVDLPTKFTNRGSIANTRHNLTQKVSGLSAVQMDPSRNDYGEICVYCHTPHGADTNVKLPLWNRTTLATTYKTYNQLGTSSLTQTVSQPGANSLSCLSCHDGQTAIDSIINMPGSGTGRYLASQATSQNKAFLDGWRNASGLNTTNHRTLNPNAGNTSCLACHSPNGAVPENATDFTVFATGTDLTNDHPVGINFPTTNGPGTDFKAPTGTKGNATFFDSNSNGNMDTGDVRLYDAKVECASCHDPHGVPSGAAGSTFNLTFMRVANTNSAVCLTCHAK